MRPTFLSLIQIKLIVISMLYMNVSWAVANEGVSKALEPSEAALPRPSVTISTVKFTESAKGADATSQEQQIQIVQIKGAISKKLLANIRKNISPLDSDPIPAGLIVFLDSRGGDGMAAIEIGKILRKANAHVFVSGECSSACILVLAGGIVRGAPTFSVGIHQARVTLSSDSGVIKKEVDANQDPIAKSMLETFNGAAKAYFAEMDIPPDLFKAMQSHTTKRVYRLSSPEITAYGLNGIEKDYLERRVQMYAQKPGRWPKEPDELARRTMKVPTDCINHESNPVEFTKCYRRVLQDIY
jgi:ATP-dependent protease ClpP protease subunit